MLAYCCWAVCWPSAAAKPSAGRIHTIHLKTLRLRGAAVPRFEEALPAPARILALRHGLERTTSSNVDATTSKIAPSAEIIVVLIPTQCVSV